MKKIIKIIFLVIIISKIFQICVLQCSTQAIEKFARNENWHYWINMEYEGKEYRSDEYFAKEKLKRIDSNGNSTVYIDNSNMTKYIINDVSKTFYCFKSFAKVKSASDNFRFENHNKFIFNNLFKTLYIVPIKYNDKIALKIVSTNENCVIDIKTMLPIYEKLKEKVFLNGEAKIEYMYTYFFYEKGTVTEEDVKLPDLSEYKLIDIVE